MRLEYIEATVCISYRLSYLHSQKIVHRDVKTENMLLDKTRTVKIADFGVARLEASNPNDMTGETGTLGYMAPEVCKLQTLGTSAYDFNPLLVKHSEIVQHLVGSSHKLMGIGHNCFCRILARMFDSHSSAFGRRSVVKTLLDGTELCSSGLHI